MQKIKTEYWNIKEIKHWKEGKRHEAEKGQIQVVCESKGYYISNADYMLRKLRISTNPIKHDSYYPEIYIDSKFRESKQHIKIQTTSWGALEISEIDTVMECYKEAHEIEKYIPRVLRQKGMKATIYNLHHRKKYDDGDLHEH